MALIEFKDLPDTSTPLTADNLNNNFEYLDDKIPETKNTRSDSTEDTYSCDYINDCETYSTSETKTNKTWINGKPIYRKVAQVNSPSTANSFATRSIGVTNLETLTKLDAYILRSNFTNSVPFKENDTTYADISYVHSSMNVSIRVGSAMVDLPMTIILEYTKTTD